ncbi:MAG TPA: sigma-70 family RNA polymerase sigma factor [Chloroflexota bacterium]
MSTAGQLDAAAFAELAEPHRHELQVHCYRMLGSFDDAEDAVQESLLRAWRQRASFEGRSPFRAWLYRIATNACLDSLRRNTRRVLPQHVAPPNVPPEQVPDPGEVRWLQPYPDRLIDQAESSPEAHAIARETIELTFIAALQLLPSRQRAALLVREVLGWSANETAVLLETSVASVNSLVQRARATLQRNRPPRRTDWAATTDATDQERALLERFMRACERGDAAAIVDMLGDDVRCTMPPYPWWFAGKAAVAESFRMGLGPYRPGEFRVVPTRANRQPACATYVRVAGDTEYRAFAIDVLRIEHSQIVEVTAFHELALFEAFGLPLTVGLRTDETCG